jgi:FkbM family methyltransferase
VSRLKTLIKSALKAANLTVQKYDFQQSLLAELEAGKTARLDLEVLRAFPGSEAKNLDLLTRSTAQLRQDVIALNQTAFKRDGFFVEFGATNGVDLSNTWLLEKEFAWTGILAEPARVWQADLARNRTAHIETDCVWSRSGERLAFSEALEVSSVTAFGGDDRHSADRASGVRYEVDTISINDLQAKYEAPAVIDFLSIDTEGSENEILSSLDFGRYRFSMLACEHNFTGAREKIHQLLTPLGYQRVLEDISQWDDWYVFRG